MSRHLDAVRRPESFSNDFPDDNITGEVHCAKKETGEGDLEITHLDMGTYASHLSSLAHLFRNAFDREVSEKYLSWRYLQNPSGELRAAVGFADAELVSNYSISPVTLRYRDRCFKGALSMTTMTSPAHRRQGWFVRLAEALYERLSGNDYAVIYGFPNEQSESGFAQKLRWELSSSVVEVGRLIGDDDPDVPIGETDDGFELRYANLDLGGFVAVEKSVSYLRWRYAFHPTNRYTNLVLRSGERVRAFCVVKDYGDSLDIVDMQVEREADAALLVRRAVATARARGHRKIQAWTVSSHFLSLVYEDAGFRQMLKSPRFGRRFIGNPEFLSWAPWYLQMGDSDVY